MFLISSKNWWTWILPVLNKLKTTIGAEEGPVEEEGEDAMDLVESTGAMEVEVTEAPALEDASKGDSEADSEVARGADKAWARETNRATNSNAGDRAKAEDEGFNPIITTIIRGDHTSEEEEEDTSTTGVTMASARVDKATTRAGTTRGTRIKATRIGSGRVSKIKAIRGELEACRGGLITEDIESIWG